VVRSSGKLEIRKYDNANRDYEKGWSLVRETLYQLCKQFPDHSRSDWTNAKVLLIGRAFASGIERQVKPSGDAGSAISIVADHMYRNRRTIDRILNGLATMAEPLTPDKLDVIIDCHGQLCRILSQVTRRKNPPRSFVSKYLHFHSPLVPMFDSIAYDSVWRWCRAQRDERINRCYRAPYALFERKRGDAHYHCFALCFFQIYEAIRRLRPKRVSVTLVDVALSYLVE
jgi:hypothetical protein